MDARHRRAPPKAGLLFDDERVDVPEKLRGGYHRPLDRNDTVTLQRLTS